MGHQQYFEDVDLSNLGYGALGGAAIEQHNSPKASPTPEGVRISLHCDHCGAPNVLTAEWPEVIFISAGALPRGWKYDQGHIRPEVGCALCRRLVSPGITPDEAQRWVRAAIHARFVMPQQADALVQQAKRGMR